jgi:hypothetical protein
VRENLRAIDAAFDQGLEDPWFLSEAVKRHSVVTFVVEAP